MFIILYMYLYIHIYIYIHIYAFVCMCIYLYISMQVLIESDCLDSLGVSKEWRMKLVKRWTRSEHARVMEIALAVIHAHETTLRCERAQFEDDELNTPTVVKEILSASQAIKELAENKYASMQYDLPDISCAVRTRQSCQLMLSEFEREVGMLFKTAQIDEAQFEHYEHMLFHQRLHLTHRLPDGKGGKDGRNLLTYYFEKDLDILLSEGILEPVDFKPSSTICKHRKAAECVYFISHGMARIYKDAGVGRDPTQLMNEASTLVAGARFGGAEEGEGNTERAKDASAALSSAAAPSEVTMVSTPARQDSVADIFHTAASHPEAVALKESAGASAAAVPKSALSKFKASAQAVLAAEIMKQEVKKNQERNELLLGAGCCFNDVEFLVKDATGFECDNFGHLKAVTDVRCFRLKFDALKSMSREYKNFLERLWVCSGPELCFRYPELLNHAPPEDWTWSSAVMEEYPLNTQLQLDSCILLVGGEVEQKQTKRRGSFSKKSGVGNDEGPLNSHEFLYQAVSFIYPSDGDVITVRSDKCKVLCQKDSRCTIVEEGRLSRQISRRASQSFAKRKTSVELRVAQINRPIEDMSKRMPTNQQSRHDGHRKKSQAEDQFFHKHKITQQTNNASSLRVPPSSSKFLREDSIPEHVAGAVDAKIDGDFVFVHTLDNMDVGPTFTAAGFAAHTAGPMAQDLAQAIVDLEAGKVVYVEGSSSKPYELMHNTKTGVYSCTCAVWSHMKGPEEQKTCRHLLRIRGKELEMRRLGKDGIAEMERAEQELWSHEPVRFVPMRSLEISQMAPASTEGEAQAIWAQEGQASVGTVAPRTFNFQRDGTDYMVSVSNLKENLGSVMDRAQKSDVMLRGATKVSYGKKRRGVETDVVQELSDFRQLEAAIFFDSQMFPSLDFDLT